MELAALWTCKPGRLNLRVDFKWAKRRALAVKWMRPNTASGPRRVPLPSG